MKWIGTVADGRVGRRVMGREGGYRSQSGIGAGRFTNVSVTKFLHCRTCITQSHSYHKTNPCLKSNIADDAGTHSSGKQEHS